LYFAKRFSGCVIALNSRLFPRAKHRAHESTHELHHTSNNHSHHTLRHAAYLPDGSLKNMVYCSPGICPRTANGARSRTPPQLCAHDPPTRETAPPSEPTPCQHAIMRAIKVVSVLGVPATFLEHPMDTLSPRSDLLRFLWRMWYVTEHCG